MSDDDGELAGAINEAMAMPHIMDDQMSAWTFDLLHLLAQKLASAHLGSPQGDIPGPAQVLADKITEWVMAQDAAIRAVLYRGEPAAELADDDAVMVGDTELAAKIACDVLAAYRDGGEPPG